MACTCLGSVHLVDGDDELTHTKGESKESVLASLPILGDTGFEFTGATSNDEDSAVSLGGTSNHVLDEVTMPRSINDLEINGQSNAHRYHRFEGYSR